MEEYKLVTRKYIRNTYTENEAREIFIESKIWDKDIIEKELRLIYDLSESDLDKEDSEGVVIFPDEVLDNPLKK